MNGWSTPATSSGALIFERKAGTTASAATGPTGGASGSFYVYAETSSPNYPNKNFDMQKSFPSSSELYGIAFQYHMYGTNIGTAVLETKGSGGTSWVSLWSKSGNQGNQWRQAAAYAGSGQTMLRFTYTSGTGWKGDFALDDIQIGDCVTVGCSGNPNLLCMVPGGTCNPATGRCSVYADGTPCDSETTRIISCFACDSTL